MKRSAATAMTRVRTASFYLTLLFRWLDVLDARERRLRSLNSVPEHHDAAVRQHFPVDECQLCLRPGRHERDSRPEKNGHHGDFDGVDNARVEKRAEEHATAEQPDIAALLLLQRSD